MLLNTIYYEIGEIAFYKNFGICKVRTNEKEKRSMFRVQTRCVMRNLEFQTRKDVWIRPFAARPRLFVCARGNFLLQASLGQHWKHAIGIQTPVSWPIRPRRWSKSSLFGATASFPAVTCSTDARSSRSWISAQAFQSHGHCDRWHGKFRMIVNCSWTGSFELWCPWVFCQRATYRFRSTRGQLLWWLSCATCGQSCHHLFDFVSTDG